MTSLAEAFGLGRGCFGREGVLRGTGTFPETGGQPALLPGYQRRRNEVEDVFDSGKRKY